MRGRLGPREIGLGGAAGSWAGISAGPARHHSLRVHTGDMGRIIGTIIGAILAIWLVVTTAGGILATFKMFVVIGLIAMAVFVVVWLVAKRPRRD
jgi:hypothetical protein